MSDDNQAPVVSIKGFDQNFRCRGFQFEVGQTYSVGGKVKACETGFHGCPLDEHPFSVTAFYGFQSRFAIVEQSGERDFSGTKLASASITIKAEISLHDLIARAVEWVFDRSWPEGASATGHSGAASATGYRGAASATGVIGAASATGYSGAASATGVSGAAIATGDIGAASATGIRGAASAAGVSGAASATGDRGAASATGYRGAASATGVSGAASATGVSGAASATGKNCVAVGAGYSARAMATETNAICLVCRDDGGSIIAIRASKAGENGVKPGIWYSLDAAGEFVECEAV